MKARIPISLAVEDDVSERVVRRVLKERSVEYDVGPVYGRRGFGYLKRQVASFNNAARASPFLLLTDLDQCPCPPSLLADWLGQSRRHPHFIFRVAVREVESWLLADDVNLASFLGSRRRIAIPNPEGLEDPKSTLLGLAAEARRREIRDAIVWRNKGSGELLQGPDYNGALAPFVEEVWNIRRARERCPSLAGFFAALDRLEKRDR